MIIHGDLIGVISGGLYKETVDCTDFDITGPLDISSALLLHTHIEANSIFTNFPLYIGYLPDGDDLDNCCAVYDGVGIEQGRLARGKVIEYPVCQIKVRSSDLVSGRLQIQNILNILEAINKQTVDVEGVYYMIGNIVRVSSILYLGTEIQNKRHRYLHTVNIRIVVNKVTLN